MTSPLGDSEFCFPRDQSLSVICFSDVYASAPSFARPPSRLDLVKNVTQSSVTLCAKHVFTVECHAPPWKNFTFTRICHIQSTHLPFYILFEFQLKI